MIEKFINLLTVMNISLDNPKDKENEPISHHVHLTHITYKSIFKCKLLKWIRRRKKEDINFGVKFYEPSYTNMRIDLPFMIVTFSKDLKVPAEVDFENKILYIGEAYKNRLDQFFKNEGESK